MWSFLLLAFILTGRHCTLSLSTTPVHSSRRAFLKAKAPTKITGCCQSQHQLNRYVRTSSSSNIARFAHDDALAQPVAEDATSNTDSDNNGEILSPAYYKSVYETDDDTTKDDADESNSPLDSQTPWDIGRAQPTIVQAYNEGKFHGSVLDAGCGFGENCLFLAGKQRITSVVGFDLAEGAVATARERAEIMEEELREVDGWWTTPRFFGRSCTELSDGDGEGLLMDDGERLLFDTSIDSGLLHCLSDADAQAYVAQLATVVKSGTGRAYVGCFSTANPDPWSNPRRLDEDDLRRLFCRENGWEVVSVKDAWWGRPSLRGSSQGAFCMALWMEARRL